MIVWDVAGRSHVGRIRDSNEDAFVAESGCAIVADGLGGLPAGEIASAQAVAEIARRFRTIDGDVDAAFTQMQESISAANTLLMQRMADEPSTRGMATTVVGALLRSDCALHVYAGDSSLFWIRAGEVRYHTDPQGIGHVVFSHLGGHESAALHVAPSQVAASRLAVEIGDVLVLCSDGLTDEVDQNTVARLCDRRRGARTMVDDLIDAALKAGGRDNVTVVVARAKAEKERSAMDRVRALFGQ